MQTLTLLSLHGSYLTEPTLTQLPMYYSAATPMQLDVAAGKQKNCLTLHSWAQMSSEPVILPGSRMTLSQSIHSSTVMEGPANCSHTHWFTYYLWLLSHCKGRVSTDMMAHKNESISLLSDPLQKTSANTSPKYFLLYHLLPHPLSVDRSIFLRNLKQSGNHFWKLLPSHILTSQHLDP